MGSLNLWQNGHRGTRFAITTPDSICIVTSDVGLCRSGRIGGAAGSPTSVYSRKCASRCATISAEGKKPAFPDQKRVCRNRHRRVMVKRRKFISSDSTRTAGFANAFREARGSSYVVERHSNWADAPFSPRTYARLSALASADSAASPDEPNPVIFPACGSRAGSSAYLSYRPKRKQR